MDTQKTEIWLSGRFCVETSCWAFNVDSIKYKLSSRRGSVTNDVHYDRGLVEMVEFLKHEPSSKNTTTLFLSIV